MRMLVSAPDADVFAQVVALIEAHKITVHVSSPKRFVLSTGPIGLDVRDALDAFGAEVREERQYALEGDD